MGNTQLPQFGSVDHENSHDTRTGVEQLTEEQRKKALADPGVEVKVPDPAVTPEEALAGHVDTGHSPSDATWPATAKRGTDAASAASPDVPHSPQVS